jgi:hypothetical protein
MWRANALRYVDGAVMAPGRISAPARPARMIVLIHGYNNDRVQAQASYDAVTRMLPDADREAVWEFFWPGFIERITGAAPDAPLSLATHRDDRETESNQLISALSYHLQVHKSRAVGRALGQYLDALQPAALIFVAHSLGCRVALEAIRVMVSGATTRRPALTGACLMAAAVPTYMIKGSSSGRPGALRDAAAAVARSFVLHSTNDYVLRTGFRIGQTQAGEGFMPEAVGVNGGPETPWSARGDTGLGHSGYWTHPSTAPATLRAIGRASPASLRDLPGLQGVTWKLSRGAELPARPLNEHTWRRTGRRETLT